MLVYQNNPQLNAHRAQLRVTDENVPQIASYALLAALGRFDHRRLNLATPDYEPQTHYSQVRDAWHGLRTPDGG